MVKKPAIPYLAHDTPLQQKKKNKSKLNDLLLLERKLMS